MKNGLTIRQEIKTDYDEVYNLVKLAFEKANYADGTEQDLVVNLRKSNAFIPELSLVAELNGKIVGYILFTKIKLGNSYELTLAPLAILPEFQKKGIGSKLIFEGHRIARGLGYHYSILLGHETYYPKFGYIPASNYKILSPFEVSDTNFMAFKLNDIPQGLMINGVVKYPKEFGI